MSPFWHQSPRRCISLRSGRAWPSTSFGLWSSACTEGCTVTTLRRLSYLTLGVAFLHLVFGAIVRITDSGMGCGPHWPDCNGYLFPPLNRPDLIIEITHRWLAVAIFLAAAATAITAWVRRREPGVGGRGGVLRAAILVVVLWFAPALLGAITVWLENVPDATIVHQWGALGLLAVVAITVVRTGGLGGAGARRWRIASWPFCSSFTSSASPSECPGAKRHRWSFAPRVSRSAW